MKLTCAIIDDEPLAVSLLESYVNKVSFLELKGKYNSAVNALSELSEQPVDVLFLDIQMPELNGLEFSRMLRTDTRIMKPISYADFLQSAVKALKWYELVRKEIEKDAGEVVQSAVADYIFIKSDYKFIQVELDKILYIEGLKDYVKIYVEGESRPFLSLTTMKALEELLPADRFMRVHRSFIVQMRKIKVIERNRIVFGKEYIPISDNCKQKFYDSLAQYAIFPNN